MAFYVLRFAQDWERRRGRGIAVALETFALELALEEHVNKWNEGGEIGTKRPRAVWAEFVGGCLLHVQRKALGDVAEDHARGLEINAAHC
jgi:hypothetical protein